MHPFLPCFVLTTALLSSPFAAQSQQPLPECGPVTKVWNDCHGTYKFDDGSIYEGSWQDDEPSGFGIETTSYGEKYLGFFKNGISDGFGVLEGENKGIYIGEFSQGTFNGVGVYFWPLSTEADICRYKDGEDSDCEKAAYSTLFARLKTQFDSLSNRDRQWLQFNLSELQLYSSSNDGLWGRETAKALVSFSALFEGEVRNVNLTKILPKITNTKSLFDLNATTLSSTPNSSANLCWTTPSECSTDALCRVATVLVDGERSWRRGSYQDHVKAAQESGLTCGVQSAPNPAAQQTPTPAPPTLARTGGGTGFVVSNEGYIVTNNHVVENCNSLQVHIGLDGKPATVTSRDQINDLALLRAPDVTAGAINIRRRQAELGEDIYVSGFPFGDRLSSSIKITKGIVSSLSGIGNNFGQIQIDAAIQPGNSGGPILDTSGAVVGVTVSKLGLEATLESFGAIPENTNFGIKSSVLATFLNSNGIDFVHSAGRALTGTQVAKVAAEGTVMISCWMTQEQLRALND